MNQPSVRSPAKTDYMNRAFRWALVGLLLICAASWFIDRNKTIDKYLYYDFEPESWESASENQRYFMAQFLIDIQRLQTLSRIQVQVLLGEPDRSTAQIIEYRLGRTRYITDAADPRLIIRFSEGVVDDARIKASS